MQREAKEDKQETAVVFRTRIGWAGVSASEKGVSGVVLPKKNKKAVERELKYARQTTATSLTNKAVKLLQRYFSGEQVIFNLPLDVGFSTPFQQAVWRAAFEIPSGETRSYAWIAKRIKKPLAVRAVGSALGANPIPIIVPCHRVISSAGTLGGFSGGLGMKKKLLVLETIHHRGTETRRKKIKD